MLLFIISIEIIFMNMNSFDYTYEIYIHILYMHFIFQFFILGVASPRMPVTTRITTVWKGGSLIIFALHVTGRGDISNIFDI